MAGGLFRCWMTLPLILVMVLDAAARSDQAGAGEPTAESMMRRAHDARALWHNLPGFSADIAIATDGGMTAGRMTVTADGELKLENLDSGHPAGAVRRLQSLVDHRLPQATREYDVAFADDVTTHPLGRLILIHDDRFHSKYRIADDVITEVHRTMGTTRFSITVTEVRRNAEGKHLPEAYSVSWWDVESGALTACDMVRNEWVCVDGFDLPARLLSVRTEQDGKREVEEVRFSNHQVFTKADPN